MLANAPPVSLAQFTTSHRVLVSAAVTIALERTGEAAIPGKCTVYRPVEVLLMRTGAGVACSPHSDAIDPP
jgi:hypothetical protein